MKEFKISVTISEKVMRDDCITALEGGVNYWMGIDDNKNTWIEKAEGESYSESFFNGLLDGNIAKLHDLDNPKEKFELTFEKLLKGYELYFNQKNHGLDPSFDIRDVTETDVIFQLAIFGDVVYG